MSKKDLDGALGKLESHAHDIAAVLGKQLRLDARSLEPSGSHTRALENEPADDLGPKL